MAVAVGVFFVGLFGRYGTWWVVLSFMLATMGFFAISGARPRS
jgi:hypothetical protein